MVHGLARARERDAADGDKNPGFLPPGRPIQGGPQLWRIPVTHDLADGVAPEHSPTDPVVPVLTTVDAPLLPRDNTGPLEFEHPQGSKLSDDGQLFYLANGFLGGPGPSWGLHVFRNRPGRAAERAPAATCTIARRIERSHNGPGGFAFEFDSECDTLELSETRAESSTPSTLRAAGMWSAA
jgi:hypothetical protein